MEIGEGSSSNGDPGEIARKIRAVVDGKKVSSKIHETQRCIFKVPKLVRKGMEEAYTPMVVSIGPYHRTDERLQSMEHFKLQYLRRFLEGESMSISDLSMELKQESHRLLLACVDKILEKEDEIRGSYADHISLSRDDFVQMVLLDSVFIIESIRIIMILLASDDDLPGLQHHKVLQINKNEIRRDLLLLENQLPLFIIHEIYNIGYPAAQAATIFGNLVAIFFNIEYVPSNWFSSRTLLDLMRSSNIGSFPSCQNEQLKTENIMSPTASHLHAAGVKFKLDEKADSLLKIEFDKHQGVLTIPKLDCDDQKQSFYRNVFALEQSIYLYKEPACITHYFHFLDCLINTKEDVQLLADKGIVENWMGSDVVCDMFNNFTRNTYIGPDKYSYTRLCKELNDHCKKKWNKWMAMLKDKYFAHPWAFISVIYAIVLLLLTIAQVILAILALP